MMVRALLFFFTAREHKQVAAAGVFNLLVILIFLLLFVVQFVSNLILLNLFNYYLHIKFFLE